MTNTPHRQLAVCTTYEELQQALRAWADELNVSRATIDQRSGLQEGYSAKILSPNPQKNLGRVTLPLLLGALGCVLILAADEAQVKRINERVTKRNLKMVHNRPAANIILVADYLHKIARAGGRAQKQKVTTDDLARFGRMGAAKRYGYRFRG